MPPVSSVADARAWLERNGIKYVLAQFIDIHGSAKAKAVPTEHIRMVLEEGAGFAGFAIWGLGLGPEGADYMAVGDPSTLATMPWMPGYARVICNGHVKGVPYPYCSRVALKRQLDVLEKEGLTLFSGMEPEFMLLTRAADGSLVPADSTDTLGVSTASAAKSAIASMLRPITSARCRPLTRCSTRAPSASVPPSPSFDARITTITYLIVTTMMSAQTNIESAPSTDGSSTVRPMSGPKAAWKA